ncbi:MAG: hypothetical protein MI861_10575, partial [Pirellulales bacterium]|nr:hypothetical protein [Pirellulales bacterium]
MFSRFGLLADWIIDHRWITFFLLVMFTAVMAVGHVDPYLLLPEPTASEAPAEDEASEDSEASETIQPLPNVQPVRVARADVIVVAKSDNFFTPAGTQAIRAAVDALESLDHVDNILWMDRAPMLNIFGLPEPILPRSKNASAARFAAARQRALEHPLVGGQLLSSDAKALLLMLQIDFLFVEDDEDCMGVLR